MENNTFSATLSMCVSYMRTVNNEYYWNGSSCEPAASFNQSCSDASSSYMCQMLTQGTICNGTGTTFTCQCPNQQFFDILINKCKSQLFYNEACSNNNMCLNQLGLNCLNGSCK